MQAGCCIESMGLSIADGLKAVAKAGFGLVELNWESVEKQFLGRGGGMGMIRSLLRETDLAAGAVYAGAVSAERVDQLRLQGVRFKAVLGRIAELNCQRCIVGAGPRTLEHFNTLGDVLAEVAQAGERVGVKVGLVNRTGTRIEDRRDLIALFLGEKLSNVGLCIDIYEFHKAVVNPADLAIEHGGRILAVRASDASGDNVAPVGLGEINLMGILASLRKVGYEGPVFADHFPAAGTEYLPTQLRETRICLEGLIEKVK